MIVRLSFTALALSLFGAAVASASAVPAVSPTPARPSIVADGVRATAEERYAVTSHHVRRCCFVELAGGGGLVSSLDGRIDSGFTGLGRVLGFGRIADDVLVGGGIHFDGRGTWTALLGVRRLISVDRLESRLDLQLVSDVAPDFALGARVAAGLARELAPGWQIGASIGFAAFAFRVHAVADLTATVTASFPQ